MSEVELIPVYFIAKGETRKVYQRSVVSDGGGIIDLPLPAGCFMTYFPSEGYVITEDLTPAEVARLKAQKK